MTICDDCKKNDAKWKCVKCNKSFCDQCVKTIDLPESVEHICSYCKDRCEKIIEPSQLVRKSLLGEFLASFIYPFRGKVAVLLFVGSIFFFVIDYIIQHFDVMNILRYVITIILSGYLVSFSMDIIIKVSEGEEENILWPDLRDIFTDILKPAILLILLIFISFGPALLYLNDKEKIDFIFILLTITGVFYFPMGFIKISIHRSFISLNPLSVIISIFKGRIREYLLLCVFLSAVIFVVSAFNHLVQEF